MSYIKNSRPGVNGDLGKTNMKTDMATDGKMDMATIRIRSKELEQTRIERLEEEAEGGGLYCGGETH